MSWNRPNTEARVRDALRQLPKVTVKRLTREIDLASADIPLDEAYRVDGVHAYIEIVNARSLLDTTQVESERSHKRFLRFLHLFQRVVHLGVLSTTTVYKVDHQNQRVHLIAYKPYDDEGARVATMVAVATALRELVLEANKLHDELPNATVRVGVESGRCLAVRNGTRGDRELLFLGSAANHAAKLLAGTADGVYLGDAGRAALGDGFRGTAGASQPLTASQLATCQQRSGVALDVARLVKQWEAERKQTPLAEFNFSRPTPPLSTLSFEDLTPKNSRRIDAAAIMADVDGFSAYIARQMGDDTGAGEAVRVLHVIRKELRDVLNDFGGRKVRYIGDCVQGVLAVGATETERARTVEDALWCAAAMRDAFEVCRAAFGSASSLGLAIGLEFGPLSLTRLGVKGSRDRCVAGNAMLTAEARQRQCNGAQTAVGPSFAAAGEGRVKTFLARGHVIGEMKTLSLDAWLRAEQAEVARVATDGRGAAITLPKAYRK